jgi:hypothetical protein
MISHHFHKGQGKPILHSNAHRLLSFRTGLPCQAGDLQHIPPFRLIIKYLLKHINSHTLKRPGNSYWPF